ncbi:glycosyltransferase family 2 protein [Paenibacillus sp. N3.4]|uniref:glycosyltransferase family 2 protein n=1 Tax=Paenibacillus sp. N3.4 TaxID=2603222 RepID=UPI00164FB9BA|nr:glycosyltransferase [Paenibacillus sp. N3.4]
MSRTTLIIPTYKAKDNLEACVNAIRSHTDDPYEIIIIDNGSNDGTDDYCRKERLTMVSLPWNHTFHSACNFGLKLSVGDNLLILKHNVLVSPHWLSEMLQCLYSEDDIGIVRPLLGPATGNLKVTEGQLNENDPGVCILFKRDLLQKVGFLQKSRMYGDHDHVFDDYCSRARDAGYRWMVAGNVTLNIDYAHL